MNKHVAEKHNFETTTVKKNAAGFYEIWCDGHALKTPAGMNYALPTACLAELCVAEWQAQAGQKKLNPAHMPYTQLAATALDIIRPHRAETVTKIMAYAESEMLCFRAHHQPKLAERQMQLWQPVLDWAALQFDTFLVTAEGLMPIRQSAAALQALRAHVENYDPYWLSGLSFAVESSGSLILALALAEKFKDAKYVFEAAELENHFQIEKWGNDPEFLVRQKMIEQDIGFCQNWFEALRD